MERNSPRKYPGWKLIETMAWGDQVWFPHGSRKAGDNFGFDKISMPEKTHY